MYNIQQRFNLYKYSHPNLTQCWLSYLEKNSFNDKMVEQSENALRQLAAGVPDMSRADLMRVLIYSYTLSNTVSNTLSNTLLSKKTT